jgi:hypothetical protein
VWFEPYELRLDKDSCKNVFWRRKYYYLEKLKDLSWGFIESICFLAPRIGWSDLVFRNYYKKLAEKDRTSVKDISKFIDAISIFDLATEGSQKG